MSQFFISYTSVDQSWAEWIAWQIEKVGHHALIQAWDFSPGSNFVLQMQEAFDSSDTTIAILSHEYLKKGFPASEWAAAFGQDPTGQNRALVPVRIEDVKPNGLLSSIVYIDLFNVSDERTAIARLLKGIINERAKPMKAPVFPENLNRTNKPYYPGVPSKKTVPHEDLVEGKEIEIRINQDFDKFSAHEQEKILRAIRELLNIDYDLKVSKVTRGSVLMTIKLSKRDALRLLILNFIGNTGKLSSHGIIDIVAKDFTEMEIGDVLAEYNKLVDNPPVAGHRENGKIVFTDYSDGYGIIHRSLGGYLKFSIPEQSDSVGLDSEVSFDVGSKKADSHLVNVKKRL